MRKSKDYMYPSNSHGDNICNFCKFYDMIDSGYGWCRRYPPTYARKHIEYPVVPWNLKQCGEFERGQ